MTEIPRWKVDAALRLLGLRPDQVVETRIVMAGIPFVETKLAAIPTRKVQLISSEPEDSRLHLLAMLPDENWSELVTVDEDELKYFTGPKLIPGSLVKYPNGTMMLTVKRRLE